ncbi:ABC transporter permease [Yoonia sp. R2331]|uniref:ABC transporter permease n=1 Tax=Yoonia sp. R2331 TaxID=3237238 RepID=UPI0034E57E93
MTDTPLPQPKLARPRFQAARTIMALILREMGSTYGASPGGYVWAVLQPVGMVMFLSLGFSLVVRAPSLGTSFILFYATAYLPFSLYGDVAAKTGNTLRYARALLAYPSVNWIDAILARFILNVLTNCTVYCLVMTGILMFVDSHTILDVGPVLIAISLSALLGLGVGLCNAVLIGLYPIWQNIWGIVTRPLILASGIFYIYEDLPQAAQSILWWNPLMHMSAAAREGYFPTYNPQFVSLAYAYGLALVLIFLGLVFMRSQHTAILEQR